MPPQIATVVYVAGIAALFYLVRDKESQTSKALWVPTLWFMILASRPVSLWFQTGPTVDVRDAYVDGSPFDAAVYGILLVLGVVILSRRLKEVAAILMTNAPILIFFAYCLLSDLWTEYPFVTFKRWIKAIGDLMMVLVILTDSDRLAAIRRVVTRAGFILIPISLLFIKYYPDLGRSYNPWTWIPMYGGVTVGKNLLGMTCLICGLGSWWCFLVAWHGPKGKERTRRLVAYGTVVAMAIYLILTADSMTSFSCLMMAGGVMLVTSRKAPTVNMKQVHLAVAAVVFVAAFALFMDTGGAMVQALGRDPTLTGRTAIWSAAVSQVQQPLVGAGFEGFWMGDRLQRIWDAINEPGIQEAHNGYLEVYLNLGWIGIALITGLIITGYRNVLATLRTDPLMGRVMLPYFVVGVVYNFTEAGFRMLTPVWIFFLFAITSAPARRQVTAENGTQEIEKMALSYAPASVRKSVREKLA